MKDCHFEIIYHVFLFELLKIVIKYQFATNYLEMQPPGPYFLKVNCSTYVIFFLLEFYTIFALTVGVIAERCHHGDDCVVTVCSGNSSHIACHNDRCTCDAVIGEYPGSKIALSLIKMQISGAIMPS